MNLKEKYHSICSEYLEKFCEKQDIEFDGWAGDNIGGIALFNSVYCISFEDIMYDLNLDCPKWLIIEWYNYIEIHSFCIPNQPAMNYRTYIQLIKKNKQNEPVNFNQNKHHLHEK